MPKIVHKKKKIAPVVAQPEIGSVIFTAGDKANEDVWDDTELIDHWDRNVEEYRRMYSTQSDNTSQPPFQQSKTRLSGKKQTDQKNRPRVASMKTPENVSYQHTDTSTQNDDNLTNLIMAWYYCGYYTALYQAQQQS